MHRVLRTLIKHYVICTLKTEYRKYLVSIIIDNAKINIEVYICKHNQSEHVTLYMLNI